MRQRTIEISARVGLMVGLFCLQGIASAYDAGPEQCKHNECSGGVVADPRGIPDTHPKYANSQFPHAGRVADCPAGYTNNGLTCGRGADSIGASSLVASCPSGYTNIGLSCFRGVQTYAKGCTTIFKKYPCQAGFTDNGCFCGRGASSLGTSSMSCPSGYFLNTSLGRCYKTCPAGYTNMGETCYRGPDTLGMSAMSCGAGETKSGARCYPAAGVCPADREYYGGLCYSKCPAGSKRSALSTCVHDMTWRGNTHLWVVNRGLDLLKEAAKTDANASRVVTAMNEPSCRTEWEAGLWDTDAGSHADTPVTGAPGTHFYNGAGTDADGNATSVVTYKFLGDEQNRNLNARVMANALLKSATGIGPSVKPAANDCYALGRALHYMTDITQPMHATTFSGGDVPLMLHPVLEEYWPTVQHRFPAAGNWDYRWAGTAADQVFHQAAVKSAGLAPGLMKTLKYGGSLCTMTPESGITYSGYCFLRDPAVDAKLGEILQDAYHSTASYVYAAFNSSAGGSNMALGRPALQSSVAYGGDAGRAVDGNSNSLWWNNSITHTDYQAEPYWEVDLGSVKKISSVRIFNRTDCCAERLSDFRVFIKEQPFASTRLADTEREPGVVTLSYPGQAAPTVGLAVPSGPGSLATGRYVRVQLAGVNYLSLAEVEVMGY